MRMRIVGLTSLLALLAAPAVAQVPTPPAAPAAAPAEEINAPRIGFVDFGVRGTSITGDAARFERYRDMGDGAFLETFRWNRQPRNWFIDVAADHVGREDQRFAADFVRPGKLEVWALWDQIPMHMSNSTRTLFTVPSPGVLEIDNALQAQIQTAPSALASVFASSARTFPLESRRHIAQGGVQFLASPELTLHASVQHTNREGEMPFGGSFGHSSLVETPAPIRHTAVDVDAGAEFSRGRFLARGGYTGSFFHNDVTSLVFDNPFRATDAATASARGRIALAPSNSFVGVNGLASVSMPGRTRATASISLGSLTNSSDSTLLPHTVNTALAVAPLPRSTVEGEARTKAITLRLTSRPRRAVDFSVRYRSYDYDNRTQPFTITQRVGYDNSVSTLAAPKETEPFGVLRHTFDADVRVTPIAGTTAGIGFTRVSEERTHRIFESTTDNVVRVTFDVPSRPWFTVRTKYEHGEKSGKGDDTHIAAELAAVGEQPGMRHFDIASRDRDRVTILGSIQPADNMAITMSIAAGKDDYLESLFGLRDNSHRVYSLGLDATPTELVTFGGSYEVERYKALSRSRQANPGVQFTDPSRNWATDATDRVHSISLNAGVLKLAGKFDVNLSYDYNRARAFYNYITGPVSDRTLPEEAVVPSTLPVPTQLPPTRSELQRAVVDLTYALGPRLGVGLSYWYEDYKVTDFTLDIDANPELARGQALLIGYLYRPYTAHTVWARILYRW